MADYSVNGVDDSFASTAIAGVVGFAVVLGLGVILGKILEQIKQNYQKTTKQHKLLNSHMSNRLTVGTKRCLSFFHVVIQM